MTPAEELYPLVAPQLAQLGLNGAKAGVLKAIAAVKTRSRTTLDVAKQGAVRLDAAHVQLDDKATRAVAQDPGAYRASLPASRAALRRTHCAPAARAARLRPLPHARRAAPRK